jgi:hypothetical protein
VFPLIGNLAALPEARSIACCLFFDAAVYSGHNPHLRQVSGRDFAIATVAGCISSVILAGVCCGGLLPPRDRVINSIGMIPGNPREIDSIVLILWQGSSKAKPR